LGSHALYTLFLAEHRVGLMHRFRTLLLLLMYIHMAQKVSH